MLSLTPLLSNFDIFGTSLQTLMKYFKQVVILSVEVKTVFGTQITLHVIFDVTGAPLHFSSITEDITNSYMVLRWDHRSLLLLLKL